MIGMTGNQIEIGSSNVVLNLRETAINNKTNQPYTAKEWEQENGVERILNSFGWKTKRNGKVEYIGRKA